MKTWRLKRGSDQRVRAGHPWVFASELSHSARECAPGEVVRLVDFREHFVCIGYTHPTSQICLRKLSAREDNQDFFSPEFFVRRLKQARELRVAIGWHRHSHRWVFAENDFLPGLTIDAFLRVQGGWVVVVQASTAAMDLALPNVFSAIEEFRSELGEIILVNAPNSRARLREGLAVGDKGVVNHTARDLQGAEFLLSENIKLFADILGGQKTGLFLDQAWNCQLLQRALRPLRLSKAKILDICCYVGQWSAFAEAAVAQAEVTLLDVSRGALALAEQNLKKAGADVEVICADALEHVSQLPESQFDVVICDPPAFVKKKADLEPGLRAYAKLNREALRRLKPGGVYVGSSCSGLVSADDWRGVMAESGLKSGRTFRQLYVGGLAPDHPQRADFPEGNYLKCAVGRGEYPL